MGAIADLLEIYRAQFKVTIALQLQYRAQLAIWLLFTFIEPVVLLVVWSTVADSSGGQVGDYSAETFAAYYIAMMMVNHLTFTWLMFEFEFRIRQGQFSPKLLRPVHPIHADIADNLSYKLLTLVVMIPVTIVLTVLFHPALHPPPWAVAGFAVALVLAFLLRFLLEWTLALAAFWTTRVAAVNDAYLLSAFFFSGQIAPLALFPGAVRGLAALLPFRWTIAFPVELLLGRVAWPDMLWGFGAQIGWALFAFALLSVVWRHGLQRYTAVGA